MCVPFSATNVLTLLLTLWNSVGNVLSNLNFIPTPNKTAYSTNWEMKEKKKKD